jgi:MerR family transcriptional regulator/heat shock protein HspR
VSAAPDTRPLFMIGVAAELAGMHPQTLRVWERRGLLSPRRTARNTRLYSHADVELLRRIQELSESGLNLAGIERVLALEARVAKLERRAARLEDELVRSAQEHRRATERARRRASAEIVVATRRSAALVRPVPPVVR